MTIKISGTVTIKNTNSNLILKNIVLDDARIDADNGNITITMNNVKKEYQENNVLLDHNNLYIDGNRVNRNETRNEEPNSKQTSGITKLNMFTNNQEKNSPQNNDAFQVLGVTVPEYYINGIN